MNSPVEPILRPALGDAPAHLANAVLRIGGGLMLLAFHGAHKAADALAHLAAGKPWALADEVRAMGLPAPHALAAAATIVQVLAPVLLILGLAARPAAAALTLVLAGALTQNLLAHRDPQLALLYTLLALTLALWGAGPPSLDHAFWGGRRAGPRTTA